MEKLYQVKVWGLTWMKNASDEGGAQAHVIKSSKSDEIVIHSHYKKTGRMWTSIVPEDLENLTKTNKGLYEVIQASQKRKVYFDIDGTQHDLKTIQTTIEQQFPGARFQVSGNETDGNKSWHIILSNYYFQNQEAQGVLVAWIHTLDPSLQIDKVVYSRNRNFKCINQSKINKLSQDYIMGSEKRRFHFVLTGFDDDAQDASALDWNKPIILKQLELNKKTHFIDILDVPEMNLVAPKVFNYASASIQEKLQIIPAKECPHKINLFLMSYFKENGGLFNQFWEWKKQKNDSSEKYNYWAYQWENSKQFKYRDKTLETLIKRFYPSFKKYNWDSVFMDDCNIRVDLKPEEKYLGRQHIKGDQDLYLAFPMGRNKTGAIIDWIQGLPRDKSILWISARIAYSKNLIQRLTSIPKKKAQQSTLDGTVLEEPTEYEDLGFHAYTDGEQSKVAKARDIQTYNRVICSIESIGYTYPKTYEILVFDEIESLPQIWLGSTTSKRREGIWGRYLEIIKASKKLILMDAFPKQSTIDWFEKITGRTIQVVKSRHAPDTRPMSLIHSYQVWRKRIVDDIKSGENVFIHFPYVNEIKGVEDSQYTLASFLKAACNLDDLDIILHNGQMGDKDKKRILGDVNTHWGCAKVVMCNSAVTVGVNCDMMGHFKKVYSYYSIFTSPRNTIQTMGRIREVLPVVVYMEKPSHPTRGIDCDFEHPDFVNMKKAFLAEEHSKGQQLFLHFCNEAGFDEVEVVLDDKAINDEIHKEFMNLELQSESLFSWDKIPGCRDLEALKKRIYTQVATMTDKLMLEKTTFREMFRIETPEEVMKILWDSRCKNFVDAWSRLESEHDIKSLISCIENGGFDDWKPQLCMKQLNERFNMRFNHPRICNEFVSGLLSTYFTKPVWIPRYDSRTQVNGKDCMKYETHADFEQFKTLCAEYVK